MPKESDLRHSWHLLAALPVLRIFVWFVLFLFGPMRVKGRSGFPRTGGVLIVSNHQSDIDPVIVQHACPRPIHFIAKSELFRIPVLGAFMRWFKAFPIERGAPDRKALRRAIELVKAGEVVCIFPEGRLSKSGRLLPVLPGLALVARKAGGACIGLSISGSRRIMPYGTLIPRPALGWVEVQWSGAKEFEDDADVGQITEWATEAIGRALPKVPSVD